MSQSQPAAAGGEGAAAAQEASVEDRFLTLLGEEDPAPDADDPSPDESDSDTPEDGPEHPEDGPAPSDDDEPTDDPDDEPAPAPVTDRLHTIEIDGQQVEVAESELHKGYLRTDDYTRKTQAVAEEKAKLVAEQQQVAAKRDAYLQRLAALDKILAEDDGVTPEKLAELRESDPGQYAAILAERGEKEREREKVAKEADRVQREAFEEQQKSFKTYVAAENAKLFAAIPEWKDAKVQKAELQKIAAFGQARGFSAEELKGITDHRAFLVLRDAMLLSELRTKQPQLRKAPQTTAPAKPGATTATTLPKQPVHKVIAKVDKAKAAVRASGSKKDALSAFSAILEASGE